MAVVGDTLYTVVLHRRHPAEWRLPKGKLRSGEMPREAAVREVEEETGITALAHNFLGQAEYEYVECGTNRKVHKRVLYYLMPLAAQQTITVESATFDQGRWVPVTKAERLLTFDSERRILRQAVACIDH